MNSMVTASLAKRRALLANKEKGFTLVELLVVVLIIGILAAVAIPMFLAQRQGAYEAQVKSDIANAMIAAETYAVSRNGSYASLSAEVLKSNGYNPTAGVTITATPGVAVTASTGVTARAAGSYYTLTGIHTDFGSWSWIYSSVTGLTEREARP